MIVIVLLIPILMILPSCGPHPTSGQLSLDPNYTNAIVGGKLVQSNSDESKLAVMIRGKEMNAKGEMTYSFCTGAFISENIIVTAAHCFARTTSQYEVAYSLQHKSTIALSELSTIESIILHDGFTFGFQNQDSIRDDIALVKIANKKPPHFEILELPPKLQFDKPFFIQAIGYGRTEGTTDSKGAGQGIGILRNTSLLALDLMPAKSYFVVDQTGGSGVCQGDSGGPGILKLFSKKYLLGIVNSVTGTPDRATRAIDLSSDICKRYAVYMNVYYYKDWIQKQMEILNK